MTVAPDVEYEIIAIDMATPTVTTTKTTMTAPTLEHARDILSSLGTDALTCLQEVGLDTPYSVRVDLLALCGSQSRSDLLEICLDGADADRESGWRSYVNAVSDVAVTLCKIDPVAAAQDDCLTAVREGADSASIADDPVGADEVLINAMGRVWVQRAAGSPDLGDASWEEFGLPWCHAYSEAFRAMARALEASAP